MLKPCGANCKSFQTRHAWSRAITTTASGRAGSRAKLGAEKRKCARMPLLPIGNIVFSSETPQRVHAKAGWRGGVMSLPGRCDSDSFPLRVEPAPPGSTVVDHRAYTLQRRQAPLQSSRGVMSAAGALTA